MRSLQSQLVTQRAEANDAADGDVGKIGVMSERLTGEDVREVNLDERNAHAQQRVAQGNAGVGVGARVDQDEIDAFGTCLVHAVHQQAFLVALERGEAVAEFLRFGAELGLDIGQRGRPVDTGFAGPQQVQVGTI